MRNGKDLCSSEVDIVKMSWHVTRMLYDQSQRMFSMGSLRMQMVQRGTEETLERPAH